MLEFLSSESWINPQIDYLLYLQNLRGHIGPAFDSCFMSLTRFGEMLFPTLMMVIVYWCFDLKSGIFLFTLNSFGLITSQFLKMVACVYRPWILSDKIKPIPKALHFAGGYSFPSGHCAMASTSWGGLAFLLAKKHKFWTCLIIFLILLVAFSRNYVGVHTPQDVVAGLLLGLVLIFALNWVINWCEKDKKRYLYLLAFIDIVVCSLLYYVITKTYPVDYINGEIIVKPQRAIYITVIYGGWIIGIMHGAVLCKTFFPYEPKNMSNKEKTIIGIIGSVLTIGVLYPIEIFFFGDPKPYSITLVWLAVAGFILTGLYPLIFRNFLAQNKKADS